MQNSRPQVKSLFIRRIPSECSRAELVEYFSQYGHVEKLKLKIHKNKLNKNHAVLTLATPEENMKLLDSAPIMINGHELWITRNMSQSELRYKIIDSGQRMIYIHEFKTGLTNVDVKHAFEREVGEVESVRFAELSKLKPGTRPYGFVTFLDKSSVKQALALERVQIATTFGTQIIKIKEFIPKMLVRRTNAKKKKKGDRKNPSLIGESSSGLDIFNSPEEEYCDSSPSPVVYIPQQRNYFNVSYHAEGIARLGGRMPQVGTLLSQHSVLFKDNSKRSHRNRYHLRYDSPDHYGNTESKRDWLARTSRLLYHSYENIRLNAY